MAYARLDELKSELNLTTDTHDSQLRDAIKWATDLIDGHCHRSFVAETATREFDASAIDSNDRQLLVVDEDLLTVGTLTNGDSAHTVLSSSAYVLWPRNDSPHWGIRLKSSYAWEVDTDEVISVNGTWGYSATAPDLVKGCCLRLAAWRYKSRNQDPTTTVFAERVETSKPPPFVSDVLETLDDAGLTKLI